MIEAVIFDYDGVIRHINLIKTNQASKKHGFEFSELSNILWSESVSKDLITGKVTREEWWKTLQQKQPKLKDIPMSFIWEEVFAYPIINRELLNLIKTYQAQFKMVIFSNADKISKEKIEKQVEGTAFDHILVSAEFGVAKPDSEAFYHLSKEIGIDLGHCLFFDDSNENVLSANNLGMEAFLYESVNQVHSKLDKYSKQ